jgi:hypothetical protein
VSLPWVYVWLFWLSLEKEEMVDIILLLLSESAVSCFLRVRSVSFTSRAKGCIKFVPHSCLVSFSHKVCQIRSHVRILIIIGYYTLLYTIVLIQSKAIWLWSSSVIRIVKMKYNRINIKWWLVSTSLKIYLDILSNLYITFTIFYYNNISLKRTFFPVLVKGLYQTESYSLNVMQLIRI